MNKNVSNLPPGSLISINEIAIVCRPLTSNHGHVNSLTGHVYASKHDRLHNKKTQKGITAREGKIYIFE